MKRRTQQSGFTLMELVLVMLITCTALAIAAPKMTGWRHGAALRSAADQFMTLARLARSSAITEGTMYRIEFDSNNGLFKLRKQEGMEFKDITGRFAGTYPNPKIEGGMIQLTVGTAERPHASGDQSINFYPTGRTETSTIRFTDASGWELEVACASPADHFQKGYEGNSRGK